MALETRVSRPATVWRSFLHNHGFLGLATSKTGMKDFYEGHGYPRGMKTFDPERISPEPEVLSSQEAAIHKARVATSANWGPWLGVDVLTGVSHENPYQPKKDVEWEFFLKPDRKLKSQNPEHQQLLKHELEERYSREFWSLWQMTWALGIRGQDFLASMSLSVIGHYPHGIPEDVVERSMQKNPKLAFKIGPGIDLASQYRAHGDGKAKAICCSEDGAGFNNRSIEADRLVSLVVFRYLTTHELAKGILGQFIM